MREMGKKKKERRLGEGRTDDGDGGDGND